PKCSGRVLAPGPPPPNPPLAVIRPKPRPDSPTASEISVIMLKSELPHEAPNPVSKKAARVPLTPRQRGGRVAARRAGAAKRADAGDWIPQQSGAERLEPYLAGIP